MPTQVKLRMFWMVDGGQDFDNRRTGFHLSHLARRRDSFSLAAAGLYDSTPFTLSTSAQHVWHAEPYDSAPVVIADARSTQMMLFLASEDARLRQAM
jgi:hypothetical protein